MVIAPSSADLNLSQLLLEAELGKTQLPDFQRDWKWPDEGIRGLLASISQGFPINSIMRLQYGNPNVRFRYRPLEGIDVGDQVPETLIMDGQQRLTSLYQATYSKNPVNTKTASNDPIQRYYYLDMRKCIDESVDRVDAVLSIPSDKKLKENFNRDIILDLSQPEYEYRKLMFPINIIFHADELTDWTMGFMVHHLNNPDALDIFRTFKSQVIDTIIAFKLPVTLLDKSTPKEAVCKIFEYVNTGGVPLTVFELVTASFAADDFNLREDWEKSRSIIRGEEDTLRTDLFDGIDETAFLTAVTLYTSYRKKIAGVSGMVSCKRKDVLSLSLGEYEANRDAVLDGFKIARALLVKYQYVFRMRDLPYTTQVIPLAAICAYLGKSKCEEPNTIDIISKWYWCGIFGEMYGGANETRFANDIEDVIDEIEGRESQNRTKNAAYFSSARLLTMQSRLSAAYKGMMALLYKERCRDFMNDTTIDLVNSMVDPPDIHHIFPQKHCALVGIKKERCNSVVNKTPILAATNRVIGGDAPSLYLVRLMKKVSGLSEDELKARIESHFINYVLLKSDDFDDYFAERAKALLNLIEKAMGKRVPDRASENTIDKFGKSLE